MINRKSEIKRPCLKDIFLSNVLAQNTQTAKVIWTERKWNVSGVKEEKTFKNYHCTFERKNFGIITLLLILELHSNYFAAQMYLVKKTSIPESFCSWKLLPLHWLKKFKNQGQELVSHPMQNFTPLTTIIAFAPYR